MNAHRHDAPADAPTDPPNPDRSGLSSGSSHRPRRNLAVYWAASWGGCDIALLGISERILDVAKAFEMVFWPCVADAKVRDVERLPDGSIDLCLFNGGIRNSEHEYMARLLRSKSQTLVAFGSRAIEGGMPGLANLHSRADVFATVYADSESTENPQHVCPQVNSPCIGCYGPADGVCDFGARLMSALASVVDSRDPAEIETIIRVGIPDPVGTFYRFGLAGGLLRRASAQDTSDS